MTELVNVCTHVHVRHCRCEHEFSDVAWSGMKEARIVDGNAHRPNKNDVLTKFVIKNNLVLS